MNTVEAMVDAEATRIAGLHTLDRNEIAHLFKTLKAEGFRWAQELYTRLTQESKSLVYPDMRLRLDLLEARYADELTNLLRDCAARRLASSTANVGDTI